MAGSKKVGAVRVRFHGSIPERLANKHVVDPGTGCWLWLGALTRRGYSNIRIGGKTRLAHRVSYEHYVGPIPDGLQLDHLCRVKNCINPEHLEPVSAQVNSHRSDSFSGKNARRTHCPSRHPYSGANLIVTKEGRRACRTCKQARDRARWHAQK